MPSYLQKIRAALGPVRFIHPAARILIENERGEFLIIERVDTGGIGLPAGGLEEGETIADCIRREWRGTIDVRDTAEVRRAGFVPRAVLDGLPSNERSILESLAYHQQYGRPQLK